MPQGVDHPQPNGQSGEEQKKAQSRRKTEFESQKPRQRAWFRLHCHVPARRLVRLATHMVVVCGGTMLSQQLREKAAAAVVVKSEDLSDRDAAAVMPAGAAVALTRVMSVAAGAAATGMVSHAAAATTAASTAHMHLNQPRLSHRNYVPVGFSCQSCHSHAE